MNRFIPFILLFYALVLLGCGDDPEADTAAAQKKQTEGWTAYNRGNFSTALLNFEGAIDLDPALPEAYNGLGWSHLSVSQASSTSLQTITKAQKAFEGAVRLDASNADAWIGLANTLFLRRQDPLDFHTALRAVDNALGADPQTLFRHDYQSVADLYTLRAACYYYLGETGPARSAINSALKIAPQNTSALSLQQLVK